MKISKIKDVDIKVDCFSMIHSLKGNKCVIVDSCL